MQWKNGLWHSYSDDLTSRFGAKVYKVTVSAGFTCPTRDGTKGTDGCSFCDERGSASFYSAGQASLEIRQQIERMKPIVGRRFRAKKFIAYFQSFTNTYGPLNYLREVYDGAINAPDVVGLAIGTRPDCVPNDVLALLNGYGRNQHVSLELGLQSFRDEALDFYQRGHTVAEGINAVERALRFPNLNVSVHLMFGAPCEAALSGDDLLREGAETARHVNKLGVHGVKVHQLMVLKDTVLATRFAIKPWPLFELERYNRLIMAFLEHLNPSIHVERTHALSSHPKELVGPLWAASRFDPQNSLQAIMKNNGSYQGKYFAS